MAGYNDTRNLIIEALMGRQAGTEIQPEKHQAYALNMLDYVRSVELVSSSTLVGLAEESTVPVQPDQGKVCYIAGVGQDRTVTFSNFIDDEGNPISITTGEMEGVFVILLWNMEHWVAYTFNTNIISSAESANFYYDYNIRKTYASVAAMNADSVNPIGTDGRLIKIGELVTVVNSTTPAENGYYSYEGSENGWLLQSGFSFEVVQTTGTDINRPMSQKAVTDELALKIDKTSVKQVTGESLVDVMSQKAVTDEIAQTDLNSKLSGVKITKGNNLLNRNYVEPLNPFEYEKGGNDKLISGTTGIVIDNIGWYLSPLIEWNEQTQAIIFNCRCWAQYGEDGVTLKDIYFPATQPSGNILIDRASEAKFIRVGILKGAVNYMMNYGSTLLPYEPFKEIVQSRTYGGTPLYFQANDEITRFKELLLAESYIPQSPTYTDGVVNSPINVIWADGDTGVLTLTRNTDGLVTKIVATKIRSGVTTTLTENITRDTDGNVTLISIV
jgi:hypothetical protein